MADRIKNYQQGADEISILKDIRTTLGVTPSSYTPDATAVTRDRVVTFAQAEEELSVLGDIQTGMQQFVADTKFQVGANTGDIANIKALLQGQLYNYQTDSTEAYTKTVPAGALPYAGIEQIGGKTLVWNQLQKNTLSRTSGGVVFTFDSTDGSLTLSEETVGATRTSTAYWLPNENQYKYELIGGHQYYSKTVNTHTGVQWFLQGYAVNSIITYPSTTMGNMYCSVSPSADLSTPVKFYPQVFDLTLMYGSGNEPSTVAEFEAMFPASYYPYNAGTLLSAGVTEVESVGKNLWNSNDMWLDNDSGITINSASSITITTQSYQEDKNKYYADGSAGRYTMSFNWRCTSISNPQASVGMRFEYTDGSYSSAAVIAFSSVGQTGTVAVTTIPGKTLSYIHFGRWTYNGAVQLTEIQLEKGITKTDFVPCPLATMPIPAEVRALEGYGWSAGTAYNYVDLERKVFVKNVDRITFDGTQTPTVSFFSNVCRCAYSVANVEPFTESNLADPKIVSNYLLSVSNTNTNNGIAGVLRRADGSSQIMVSLGTASGIANVTDFTAYLTAHPLTVYYPLATPIETDISAYLTDDNLVQVEPAGTVTFKNQNGGDYRIPVPSDVTYMIDLQAAIS